MISQISFVFLGEQSWAEGPWGSHYRNIPEVSLCGILYSFEVLYRTGACFCICLVHSRVLLIRYCQSGAQIPHHHSLLVIITRYTHMHEKPLGFVSICIVIRPISS